MNHYARCRIRPVLASHSIHSHMKSNVSRDKPGGIVYSGHMDDRNLDLLLTQRRGVPLPSLKATFQQGVWREIRRRKAGAGEHQSAWFGWLLEPLLKPAMAFAALALALVMGIGLGATALADSRNAQTRLALDLHVFGSSSPSLPATLLDYSK